MKVSPKARPVRWIVALVFAGAAVALATEVRAENDEPFPSPVTTSTMFETLGVFFHGVGVGMTAIW